MELEKKPGQRGICMSARSDRCWGEVPAELHAFHAVLRGRTGWRRSLGLGPLSFGQRTAGGGSQPGAIPLRFRIPGLQHPKGAGRPPVAGTGDLEYRHFHQAL